MTAPFFYHATDKERPRAPSVSKRRGKHLPRLIHYLKDTPHAYDRNWIDRSRDAGGNGRDRISPDLHDDNLTQRGSSRLYEMLGQRYQAGA